MKKNKRILLSLLFAALSIIAIVYSQNFALYIDLSTDHKLAPSKDLKSKFSSLDKDVTITIFSSDELSDELDIKLLERWLNALSNKIEVLTYDPIKSPSISDHYDIESDGIIVIETDNSRYDIDIIEQVIINEGHHIEFLQNVILRKLLSATESKEMNALIIHSNHESLLDDPGHIGLMQFKQIFDKNFINLDEQSTHTRLDLLDDFDMIILYKVSVYDEMISNQLVDLLSFNIPVIVFNSPKLSSNMNNILNSDATFNSKIIEDSNSHLIQSENQLIIHYLSSLKNQFIGVFPYSGPIQFKEPLPPTPFASSSDTSFITSDDDSSIDGPFTLVYHDQSRQRILINNYLIPTNYWINYGDNHLIIEDIIFSMLDNFSYISVRDTDDDFIIFSYINLLKLFLILIVLPPMAYFLFRFYLIYSIDPFNS